MKINEMKKRNSNNVYNQMHRMAELTIMTVLSGRLIRAKRLLDVAKKLFENGNYQTRNAVTNVFLYDVSSVLALRHCDLMALFPPSLQKEYIKQLNAF